MFSYPHIRSLSGFTYSFIVCNDMKKLMKQGLGLVFRTDCLNFDISPCIEIKKQISIRGEGIWNIFLWDFCYRSRLHKTS